MREIIDLTGKRFGKLVVLKMLPRERDENNRLVKIKWQCRCDCGNICEAWGDSLKGGKQSCGCLMTPKKQKQWAEANAKRLGKLPIVETYGRHCPYPNSTCVKSRAGLCCWDCERFSDCAEACQNKPEKCGVTNG